MLLSLCMHFYTYGRMNRTPKFINDKVEGPKGQEADFIFKYCKNGENEQNRKKLIL